MGLVIGTGGLHIGTSGGGASPVKRFDAEAEYIKRKAGGADNIGTGKAKIPTLKGKSVVWNQLQRRSSAIVKTNNGVTFTSNGDGSVIANGTASGNADYGLPQIQYIKGHKYIRRGCPPGGVQAGENIYAYLSTRSAIFGSDRGEGAIFEATENVSVDFALIRVYNGKTVNNVKFWPQCIDLTLLFGSGYEPSTVAEFEALYPLPYYNDNAGQIVNNEAEAIETVGFNQWDEQWELGGLNSNTGAEVSATDTIRSKNYIACFGNTTYFFRIPDKSGGSYMGQLCFYDSDKAFISYSPIGPRNYTQVTTPSNASYMRFDLRTSYGTTYNNDICINLSDPARNGQYEPYEKHTLQLGLNSFNVKDSGGNIITVNGLKSAGSAYDEIDLARGKYIKRVGAVDMGSLDYNMSSGTTYSRFTTRVIGMRTNMPTYAPGNYVTPKYISVKYDDSNGNVIDKVVSHNSDYIAIVDSSYSSAATFKTAMSGVLLYYELAEPIEYDLVTPIGNSYKVISGGTEERLPRDTASSVMAPIKYSVKYVQPKD